MTKKNIKPNRLVNEKSPYLIQHAYNPVNWFAWGEEAFKKAKEEDKPIFLSIGYSTCHWCHVMERESFEDDEVADLLNTYFVCIKVDREERPDIDNMYMTACQILTGRGGWPLTIIMTPDKKPFFAGTYIPKQSRFGLLGMMELVPKLNDTWKKQKNEIISSSERIMVSLREFEKERQSEPLEETIFQYAYGEFLNRFDDIYGGFGSRPKFPSPHNLLFLLRMSRKKEFKKSRDIAEKTLDSMRLGGIWDHLGGGFHRYSTDRFWLVPHFEKMLYDQAMMTMAYSEGYQVFGKEEYEETVIEILEYVRRDMTSPEGAFFSAEDADSEGEEGKFYVWPQKEISGLFKDDADLFLKIYNCEAHGNFSDESTGKRNKTNVLHLKKPLRELARDLDMDHDDLIEKISSAKRVLFNERTKRVRPQRDDKILTDLNGLMIAAYAQAGRVFDRPEYIASAEGAADFVMKNMVFAGGGLFHRYKDGEARIPGFLDDYAFFVWGLLELYESTFSAKYLKHALDLTQYMIDHLWDFKNFGFFMTADEAQELPVRQKTDYDGAIPSGNSIAMLNLFRLYKITGSSDLGDLAFDIRSAFSKNISLQPTGHSMFLTALDFAFGPTYEIVVVGDLEHEDTKDILSKLKNIYFPNKVIIHKDPDHDISDLIPYTKEMTEINGRTTVYVCENFTCNLPVNDIEKVLDLLGLNGS